MSQQVRRYFAPESLGACARRVRHCALGITTLLVLLATGSAHARQDAESENVSADAASTRRASVNERIVVSASLVEVPLEQVGSSVTVIDREEIERRQSPFLIDLLRTVAGLEITATGSAGKVASARVRGGDASQTLVLLDGVRINDATTGDVDFSDLATDNLERIEVVRGPQAIYGSEAVAGVISLVTRRGDGPFAVEGLLEAGELDTARARVAVSGVSNRGDYSASGSWLTTGDVSHNSERLGNLESDPFENTTLSSRLGWRLGERGGGLDGTLRAWRGSTELDGFLDDDPNAEQEREALAVRLRASLPVSRRWQHSATLSSVRTDLLGFDPDSPFNNYDIQNRSTRFATQADLELAPAARLSVGYDYEDRSAQNLGSFDESEQFQAIVADSGFELWERAWLGLALRHDDHSRFGGETTWRSTAAWSISESTRLHGSLGTGFRAPDLNELYFPFAGDPDLDPETSRGADVGLEHGFDDDRGRLGLTLFRSEHDDLIDFDLGTFTFRNIDQARSQGVELELGWRPREVLGFALTHTYNDTRDELADVPLPRRPEHRSTLVIDARPTERLALVASYFVVRDRVDSSGLAMDDYERLDLVLSGRFGERLRPYLRVANALDEDYEEVPGFTTPGRAAVVGLSWRR